MAVAAPRPRHRAVPRADSERYMGLMLVSFAGCVLAVRAYLALTGYPQIGNGTLHIAHALWGGLLLFVASLLPLLVTNRWAYTWAAVLSGLGAGLFIDEVGKFITRDNDYFFPAAAPIAYGIFLLAVFVYLRARNARPSTARDELHNALDELKDALDDRLRPRQRARLRRRLRQIAERAPRPDLRALAADLLRFEQQTADRSTERPGLVPRVVARVERATSGWLTERRLRIAVIVGLGVLGLLALSDLVVIASVAVGSADGTQSHFESILNRFARIQIHNTAGVTLLLTRIALDTVAGAVLLLAAVLMVTGRRQRALRLGYASLLLSLTVVNLLVFYFDQFIAAVGALAELTVLQAVGGYQNRYLADAEESC